MEKKLTKRLIKLDNPWYTWTEKLTKRLIKYFSRDPDNAHQGSFYFLYFYINGEGELEKKES